MRIRLLPTGREGGKVLTREQALAIYHAGPEVVVRVLYDLSRQVDELQGQLAQLHERVKTLEDQLAKNSRNSLLPHSKLHLNGPEKRHQRY